MSEKQVLTALVTGGSRGIGRAICIEFAKAGYNVAINYSRNADEANQTADLCFESAKAAGHDGAKFVTVGGDVAKQEDCERIYQETVDGLGDVDILVNNAGITRDNLTMRMSVEDFDAVIDVNLRAAFIFSKLAMRPMTKKRFGRIINISSVVGVSGNAGQANYAASKAGIIGLTKTLAKELGSRNITVNAIAPGFIETSMTDALSDDTRAKLIENASIPRLGLPQDIAALVGFLAGENASYITGQVISVDGGMRL